SSRRPWPVAMSVWRPGRIPCGPVSSWCSATRACAARSSAPSTRCTWPTTSRRPPPSSVSPAKAAAAAYPQGGPMPRTLLSKLPGDFKTLPLRVEASREALRYQSLGQPLNFGQMLARRRPVAIDDPHTFSVELANLGVSVRLTLHWQGRDYWLLVRQRRPDRQDEVLKLISGYVP